MSETALRSQLLELDRASYGAYKSIKGSYGFDGFELIVDRVQGDPFAAPSRVRVRVPQAIAGFPERLLDSPCRRVALGDLLARQFARATERIASARGSGKSGQIAIAAPGQEVLERTSVIVGAPGNAVEARFTVGLPAQGRRILGRQAAALLCEDVPAIVRRSLLFAALDPEQVTRHVETVEDADALRAQLRDRGLVAFVADGAILPRRSGVDPRPLSNAIPFRAPESLRVTLKCPNAGAVTGAGIPSGITLIVGGGFHGKSTLLQAIARGVYNHRPGDGREQVVSDPDAVKIRAEDGRSIVGVDISPFINHLPRGRSTSHFSTPNASGSTSQAANIIEAIEAGARVLLVDEDTAATNFMIRDFRMQQLIASENEPITPLLDRIRQLAERGISVVLVVGGSGDYFEAADTAIAMESFVPADVTARVRAIAAQFPNERAPEGNEPWGDPAPRVPLPESIDPSRGKKSERVRARGASEIEFGSETIDLAALEQLVDTGQLRAIAAALIRARGTPIDGRETVPEVLDALETEIAAYGLACLGGGGDLAAFRRHELAAALSRLRSLRVREDGRA